MATDAFGNEVSEDSAAAVEPDQLASFSGGMKGGPEARPYIQDALSGILQDPQAPLQAPFPASFNQTPVPGSPDFARFQGASSQVGQAAQPGLENTRQLAQLLQASTSTPKPTKKSLPWQAYLAAGLSDLASILSYRHATGKQKTRIGTNEFGKPIYQSYHPQAPLPQLGGLASVMFAPEARYQQETRQWETQRAQNQTRLAPALLQFAGRELAQPKPAALPPALQTYNALKQIEQETGQEGLTQAWIKKLTTTTSGSAQDKLKQATELANQIDDLRKTDPEKAKEVERILKIAPEKAGPPSPRDKARAALGLYKDKLDELQRRGFITPDQSRRISLVTKPYDQQITRAEKELDAARKAADLNMDPDQKALMLSRVNVKQRTLLDLHSKRQAAVGKIVQATGTSASGLMGLDTGLGEESSPQVDTTDTTEAGPLDSFQADSELILPDGSRLGDWTEEDFKHLEATDLEGAKSLAKFIQEHALQ